MSSLLNFGASLLTNISTSTNTLDGQEGYRQGADAQISRLANEVNTNMTNYETASKLANEPSVLYLYFHFCLSIFAIIECSIRLAFHFLVLLAIFLSYYVVLCILCGKAKADLNLLSEYHSKMYSLYSSLFCGILSNIVVPWNPPLYAFRIKGTYLNRPTVNGQQLQGTDLNTIIRKAICTCCCCSSPIVDIPAYKILQASFFSYGGLRACGSLTLCCICMQNNNNTKLTMYLHQLRLQVDLDSTEDTRQFYTQEYGCTTFDEVIATRIESGVSSVSTSNSTLSPMVHAAATTTSMRSGLTAVVGYPVPVPVVQPHTTQHQTQQQQSSIPLVYASPVPLSK